MGTMVKGAYTRTLVLTPELEAEVVAVARREDRSVSYIIREALRFYLRQHATQTGTVRTA